MLLNGEEIFFIPSRDQNRTLVYAPLRSYVAVTSREHAAVLCSGDPTVHLDKLNTALRVRPLVRIQPHWLNGATAPKIQRLTISLSERCNLRCIYCHAYREGHKPQTLSLSMLAAAVTAFCSYARAPLLFFEFLGDGEPTLYLEGLRRCIETIECQQRIRPFTRRIALTTNGTFGVEAREFVTQTVDDLTISFDGYKEIQDRQRQRVNGLSCYQTVYDNICSLLRSEINLTLRITVTPISISHIEAILQFLAESFPGIAVRIEPMRSAGRATVCFPEASDLSVQLASALASSEVLRSQRVRIADPYNGACTMYDHIRTVGCPMLEFGNWQLASDGSISSCATVIRPNPLMLGNLGSSEHAVLDLVSSIENLRKAYSVTNRQACEACFCKYHCAGGCPVYPPDANGNFCRDVQESGRNWLENKCGIMPTTP